MANQFLALSMFIMLLSFFIILNSVSNFDDNKSQPVLNSLSVAFSKKEVAEEAAPSYEQDTIQKSVGEGDTLDQLEGLFRSQITGVDIQKNRLGTVMYIRVPLKDFEAQIMNPVPSNRGGILGGIGGEFAPALASLLETSQTKVPYRLDMVLNVTENPANLQNERPEEMRTKIAKVTSFAEKLESAGMPKKLVTSGVGKGEEGMIDLFFRRYAPFNPVGDVKISKPSGAPQ